MSCWLAFFKHHCPQCIDSSFNHLSLPPSWSEYCLFPFQDPLYSPQVVNFSRNVEKCWCHSCYGFFKFNRCSSCLTIFLFCNQLSYFKDHVYSKSSCWNEIREMLVFENQVSSVKDPTHVIRNIQSFDYHVFWKQKLTRCKIKMAFSMVLCINLNPWYWVYHMIVYDEVTFAWISKARQPSQHLGFIKKNCFSS